MALWSTSLICFFSI